MDVPSTSIDGIVYVVDDDRAVQDYLRWLLEPSGARVETFDDAASFLAAFRTDQPACLITDLRMPGLSGLDLQAALTERGADLPIIMLSGQAAVAEAVTAMRNGAVDFLQKPVDRLTLLESVRSALCANSEARRNAAERAEITAKLKRLSPRQRLVLDGLRAGKATKVIAAELGLSPKTVDVHRFRLMHALGAESLPDLFRKVVLVAEDSGSAD